MISNLTISIKITYTKKLLIDFITHDINLEN